MLSALIIATAVVLSPDPQAVKPVARPLCLVNVNATTIVYAGDVKDVKLSADKSRVWILSNGGKLTDIPVPAGTDAEAYRTSVAANISTSWADCKRVK